jgi:sec-independent protein translocase protein TatA
MLLRNFGIGELILVLVLALLVFGPGRIAKLGSELGKGIRGFKDEMKTADTVANSPRDKQTG